MSRYYFFTGNSCDAGWRAFTSMKRVLNNDHADVRFMNLVCGWNTSYLYNCPTQYLDFRKSFENVEAAVEMFLGVNCPMVFGSNGYDRLMANITVSYKHGGLTKEEYDILMKRLKCAYQLLLEMPNVHFIYVIYPPDTLREEWDLFRGPREMSKLTHTDLMFQYHLHADRRVHVLYDLGRRDNTQVLREIFDYLGDDDDPDYNVGRYVERNQHHLL